GQKSYYFFFGFTLLATAHLFYLFLAHRFEFSYVYNYSSSDSPIFYLVSSFWAGQEGTFLLWLFFGAILGLFLIKKQGVYKNHLLFFYLLIQIFLLAVLLKKSPFEELPLFPLEGAGLNPLLQDFWMVIHPPIVFVGYAGFAIPFAYALSALVQNRYKDWVSFALPWVSFSCLFLGAGIFIGGYWAYKVMGWGGYWGWDPVENASLVPWLVSVVLLHTMLLEKYKGGAERTNLILALFSFLLVMYGTFLTRSGVLAEFSLHSFTDLGINVFLIVFMFFFSFISLILVILRWRDLKNSIGEKPLLSKQSFVIMGSALILIWAVLILLGTSSPFITKMFGQASQVGTSYYVKITLPLGLIIALLSSLVIFLNWKKTEFLQIFKNMFPLLVLSLILTLLSIAYLGCLKTSYTLLIFFAFLVFTGNLFYLIKRIRSKTIAWTSLLGHLGMGLMLIGIVTSSGYSIADRINLSPNQTKSALGYNFTYLGFENTNERGFLKIEIEKDGKKTIARPAFYYSEYNQGVMKKPYIKSNLWGDLYLAPIEYQEGPKKENFKLKEGETKKIGEYKIKFVGFERTPHAQAELIKVGAILEIFKDKQKQKSIPAIVMGPIQQDELRKVQLFNTEDYLYLEEIDADFKTISLSIETNEEITQPVLVLEISKKSFIWVLWLGSVIVISSLVISAINRSKNR
ncbi:MAG TPA: cytochrome c biogenesis protein CcsA, partial [candidate division Zixibacteria bacterium]